MSHYGLRIAWAGAAFLGLELINKYMQKHTISSVANRSASDTVMISESEAEKAKSLVSPYSAPLLNVRHFNKDNFWGAPVTNPPGSK